MLRRLFCGLLLAAPLPALAETDSIVLGMGCFWGAEKRMAAVPGVIDPDKERTRLERDLKKLEKELGAVEKKLSNPSFLDRAPEAVVEKSKRDASQLREKRERIEAALRSL